MTTSTQDALEYFAGLLQKNEAHAREHGHLYAVMKDGQRPKIVIALCADSRIQTCIFGSGLELINNIFVGRDIGNCYTDSEGAVDYAVRSLGVPVLFIMGHTGCGAAAAARSDYSAATAAVKSRLDNFKTCGDAARDPQANVDAQVALALKRYAPEVAAGELTVIGGVFDLLGQYDALPGKVYLTNFNGSADPAEILRGLGRSGAFREELLEGCVKRL
ncbi:MAG: carbonic anhydrase [Elusimicrobiota bacterium]